MAVTLEGNIRRYIGLSTDDKPAAGLDDLLPAGSTFLETDTKRIYRYNGTLWVDADVIEENTVLLTAIYSELLYLRQVIEQVLVSQA